MIMKRLPAISREKAIDLRKKGLSLSEISDVINIPKNTIQGWVREIKLTKSQKERLKKKEAECGRKGLSKALQINRDRKIKWQESIKKRAKKFRTVLYKKNDIAKLLCGILYLCEGAKYPASRHLAFGSSDPRMIKLFLSLLRSNFNVDEKKFRCRIMHRYDQDGNALCRHWSKLTKIALSKFYRSYKDKRTKGQVTTNKDYKGICAVIYFSTDLQYELQSIGESLYYLKD